MSISVMDYVIYVHSPTVMFVPLWLTVSYAIKLINSSLTVQPIFVNHVLFMDVLIVPLWQNVMSVMLPIILVLILRVLTWAYVEHAM